MIEALFGTIALVGAVICGAVGAAILSHGETILHEQTAVLCFVLAGVFSLATILCSIASRLQLIADSLRTGIIRDLRELIDRRADVTTERWDMLCTSLERLEGATKKNKRPSNVGEDFDLPLDREPPQLKAKCSKCGKTVKARADWAGRTGKCPGCGWSIEFPVPTEFDGIV